MARPIEYDRVEVLDQALQAFWQLGHAGCSMQILTDATGLSRQGIYNTFGDKDGFFKAVVSHYISKVEDHCQVLLRPDANSETLKVYIKDTLAVQQAVGPGACFIVMTAFSQQAQNPHIGPALCAGAEVVRNAFSLVLTRAQQRQELRSHHPPEFLAGYLYSSMNGLSALAQTGASSEQIDAALDLAFQVIHSK